MTPIFFQIALVLVLAAAAGLAARALKQPTIVGYLAVGLVVGPLGFLKLNDTGTLDAMAQFGIAFLLFLVGMEIDLRDLKHVGRNVILIGLGQILFTAAVGLLICLGLGFGPLSALYIAVPLTFSSTVIVVKLLSESKALDSLHGKISLGVLLVQDFIALGILIVLSGLKDAGATGFASVPWPALGAAFIKGTLFLFVALGLGKWVMPGLFRLVGRSQEVLFLVSLAWGLGLAALVSLPQVGLTVEIGSFLAGLSLAGTAEHYQVSSRVRSLRDFFLVMFFIVLGSKIALEHVATQALPIAVLSAFVLVGNPLIVMVLMGLLGYRARTSFQTGMTMAMVSEFSLIVVLLGRELGQIDDTVVGTVTAVCIITIVISSYLIQHSEAIYRRLRRVLKVFETAEAAGEPGIRDLGLKGHVVLVGCHRMGQSILDALRASKAEVAVVDFNPDVVHRLQRQGVPAVYGDIADPEIQERAGIARARMVVSTVPNVGDNTRLLKHAKELSAKVRVVLTAEDEAEAIRLYEDGADYVLLPHFIGGLQLAQAIKGGRSFGALKDLRDRDLHVITSHP